MFLSSVEFLTPLLLLKTIVETVVKWCGCLKERKGTLEEALAKHAFGPRTVALHLDSIDWDTSMTSHFGIPSPPP